MSNVYLIPTVLDENGLKAIPTYVTTAIQDCQVFFVENERTTRRFFKRCWKEMIIDNYQWVRTDDENAASLFQKALSEQKNIGIVSEAGCPGVADPGQDLVAIAQEKGVTVKPLVGPNSILLALMASGLNGQHFKFNGYLPIGEAERERAIRQLETMSTKENCTQLFIETPYRNNQLLAALLKHLSPQTQLCIAVNLTGPEESIRTLTVVKWRQQLPDLHKKPVIFAFKTS
ncbi:MAG: SAM-dependent methyltransferase [Chitinophagaceae bacterium]|jgi:16S rRNA (cytidine1402-2'-O)-methyltransferase